MRFEAVGPRIALDLESTSYLPKNRSVRSPNLRLSSLNLQFSVSSASLFFFLPPSQPSFESPFATAAVSVPPTVVPSPRYRARESLSNLHLVSAQLLILPHRVTGARAGWKSLLGIPSLSLRIPAYLPTYLNLSKLHLSPPGTVHTVQYFVHVHVIVPSRFRHTHPHASQPLPLLLKGPIIIRPSSFQSSWKLHLTPRVVFCFASAIILSHSTIVLYLSMATASTWSLLFSSPCS